jgi:hypothetical protein
VKSALLDNLEFHVGEVIPVRCTGNRNALAKVVDIKCLNDERLLLELAWYCTMPEKKYRRRSRAMARYTRAFKSFSIDCGRLMLHSLICLVAIAL